MNSAPIQQGSEMLGKGTNILGNLINAVVNMDTFYKISIALIVILIFMIYVGITGKFFISYKNPFKNRSTS